MHPDFQTAYQAASYRQITPQPHLQLSGSFRLPPQYILPAQIPPLHFFEPDPMCDWQDLSHPSEAV